jgi:hypothetical protein
MFLEMPANGLTNGATGCQRTWSEKILSPGRNDSVQPRMDTDEHGFSEMIFVVSLPLADTPFGGRFGLLQNVFFIRVHLCPSVVKTTFTASFRPGERIQVRAGYFEHVAHFRCEMAII